MPAAEFHILYLDAFAVYKFEFGELALGRFMALALSCALKVCSLMILLNWSKEFEHCGAWEIKKSENKMINRRIRINLI
jgi:hypothetical protein